MFYSLKRVILNLTTNNCYGMFYNYTINQRLPHLKCNFRLFCNVSWHFWNISGVENAWSSCIQPQTGKKESFSASEVPEKRPQGAKRQQHACSSWDTQAAPGTSVRDSCLSRCCSPVSQRGEKNQLVAQVCGMSNPLATTSLQLLQHGSLFKSFRGCYVWGGLSWEEESEHQLEEQLWQLTQHLPVPVSSASAAADR